LDSDINLINNILNGHTEEYEVLVKRYQTKLYNFLFKLTLSKEDAEDILQEAFIKAYKYLNKYNSKYCFSTWLFKIATNIYKTNIKKISKNRLECNEYFLEVTKSNFNLEDIIVTKDKFMKVLDIINGLKPDYKIAVILKFFKDMTNKEIAQIMGKREGTVKTIIFRAKKTIGKEYLIYEERGDGSNEMFRMAK
jgi:RNA polymerase sigma-70 factor (ECF subfamily)